jgi:hypothetical protein
MYLLEKSSVSVCKQDQPHIWFGQSRYNRKSYHQLEDSEKEATLSTGNSNVQFTLLNPI